MADGSPRQPARHLRELLLTVNAARPATSAHGETYTMRDTLRQLGWQWDAVQKAWWTRHALVEGPELATIRAAALAESVLVSVVHLPTPTSSPAGSCPELTPLGRHNASAAGGSPGNRSLVARRLVLDARNQRHSTQEFPTEILESVCLFMPGATLLACRLVCKTWRGAINVYALKQRRWALAFLSRSPDSAAALPSWTPAHCALAGDPATVDIVAAVTRLSHEPWPQPDEQYERQALASLASLAPDGVAGLSYLPRELPAELATESRLSEWATPALGLSEPLSFWAAAAALLLTAAGGQEARCIATWLHHGLPSTPPELAVAADELCHALSCLMSTQLWTDCAALHGIAADWRSVNMAALDATTPPMPRGLTPEQKAVVDWARGLDKRVDGVPGRCAKVLAFAGTGKTLTLSSLTQELKRGMRVLYLAYNKSVKEKAEKDPAFAVAQRNGVTVHPSTTCSLAYKHVVTDAMNKRLKNDVYAREVIGLLRGEGLQLGPQPEKVVGQALKTCRNYFVSGDDAFGPQHIDAKAHDEPGQLQRVTALVPMLLDRMQDPSHAKFPFTHDCYVSRYARSQTLPLDDYDLVLVDEAQDLNGATLRMLHRVNRERGCHIIFAGDVHQHLYAFNGARNGLAHLNTDVTFRLTRTYRFGTTLAAAADKLLALKDERVPLRGARGVETRVDRVRLGAAPELDRRRHAVLVRANVTWFKLAGEALDAGHRVWVDDMETTLRRLEGLLAMSPEALERMKITAEEEHDIATGSLLTLLQTSSPAILRGKIGNLRTRCVPHRDAASVQFATVHKAKGLEFTSVEIAEDLWDCLSNDIQNGLVAAGLDDPQNLDSLHVCYTAVTRAERSVALPRRLMTALDNLPGLCQLGGSGCSACHTVPVQPTLGVRRPVFGGGVEMFCAACALGRAKPLGVLAARLQAQLTADNGAAAA